MSLIDKLVVNTLPAVPKPVVRRFSSRYIAGDTLDDAVQVTRELNQKGCMVTLDVLGEHVTRRGEAEQATREYLQALEAIAREKLDSNISIKLTQFGLKLDFDFCLQNVTKLVQRAKELKNFVRIDMEDTSCTTDTLRVYDLLRKEFNNVGVVVQAYLRRTLIDVRDLMKNGAPANFRICKGIYIEPRELAYKDHDLINNNFTRVLDEMLRQKAYVGIATHDERLVWDALRLIDELRLPKTAYEFQMLLGVDEQLRDIILAGGHRLRVYVPFGKEWYAYSVRRLKENPQIAGHVIKNFFKR
jgi:proline dehydrogenase